MPKTVCNNCHIEYRIETSGVYVIEYAAFGPYRIWAADEHKCPACHSTIITGFGSAAIAEHYQDGFDAKVAALKQSPLVRYDFENTKQREEFLFGLKREQVQL
jgi:hypothetical protein